MPDQAPWAEVPLNPLARSPYWPQRFYEDLFSFLQGQEGNPDTLITLPLHLVNAAVSTQTTITPPSSGGIMAMRGCDGAQSSQPSREDRSMKP